MTTVAPIVVEAGRVSSRFRASVSRDFARTHLAVSQGTDDGTEILAVTEAIPPLIIHNIATRMKCDVRPVVADGEMIASVIDEAYGGDSEMDTDEFTSSADAIQDDITELMRAAEHDVLSTQGKGPVVKLVDALLFEALQSRASDLHIQPIDGKVLIRCRVDGVLHVARELPPTLLAPLVSRVKVMAQMDITERRMPQDGRTVITIGGDGGRTVNLRISTVPTNMGERVVIRLLESRAKATSLTDLGMTDDVASQYIAIARRSHGMLLLTGPTGSGKTTTLYATIREVGSPERNIMTIEDPIEYKLTAPGIAISQSQVNSAKGMTFASGLRHILRQDPDIIMVGEIRDDETAAISIQASLTGHLVLSTLHTNDSASSVSRLVNLGAEPYLVSASLIGAMAQRLVRQIHADCSGSGCDNCFGSGYLGRIGLYELLEIQGDLREQIAAGAEASQIFDTARRNGMQTLAEDGARLVAAGVTSQQEVDRVVQESL